MLCVSPLDIQITRPKDEVIHSPIQSSRFKSLGLHQVAPSVRPPRTRRMSTFYFTAAPGPGELNTKPSPTPKLTLTPNSAQTESLQDPTQQEIINRLDNLSINENPANSGDKDDDDKEQYTRSHIEGFELSPSQQLNSTLKHRAEVKKAVSSMPAAKDAEDAVVEIAAELIRDLEVDLADDQSMLTILEYVKENPDRGYSAGFWAQMTSKGQIVSLHDLSEVAAVLAVMPNDPSPVSSRNSSACFRRVNQRRASRPHRYVQTRSPAPTPTSSLSCPRVPPTPLI